MQVRILFFGMLKDLAGLTADVLELREGATVADVLAHYQAQVPTLKGFLPSVAIAVNQEYASREMKLRANDEVGLLPPVSGGGETQPQQSALRRRCAFLVREKIDTAGTLGAIKHPEDGAAVFFEGVVRNHSRGRRTLYLDYEAYEEMALKQLELLADRALGQFQIREVVIIHRLGRLEIGETSVLIVVASAHRGPAFDACRWLIDTLKRTVPIWKKEYFEGGAVWADGEPFPTEIRPAQSSRQNGPASK